MHTPSLTETRFRAPWAWLLRPTVLIVTALVLSGAAAALGWPWLVAVGAAPLIVAVAPCLVMCAFGLCMTAMSKPCSASGTSRTATSETLTTAVEEQRS